MAVSKLKRAKPQNLDLAIDRVIDGGEGLASKSKEVDSRPDVKFQMVIPAELCDRIDADRAPSKTSRRAWLLQRTVEYFAERELM